MSKAILTKIRKELKKHVDLKYKQGAENFFKEDIVCYGVRAGIVRKVANQYWKEVKHLDKKEIFQLCEELLQKEYCEEATVAFSWAYRLKNKYEKSDFTTFERWLKKYVDNWAKCDDFCTHAFNRLFHKYPELYPKIKKWTRSKNRWERRAAAVVQISTEKEFYNPKNLKRIFETANILLLDTDDLVQKGYGWMLKAASHHYPAQVFKFVMDRKEKMPRTSLRYAIEKYPKEMRMEAMKK